MGKRGLLQRSLYAMALLAVAFLNFASVQSIVMQAAGPMSGMDMAEDAAPAICHVGGMETDGRGMAAHPVQARKACPFCAVASNPPLCETTATITASSRVIWTRYAAQASLGPRGPPAFAPNARGPPIPELTI
jgi:Protein of unknown function (DUF2946)